jgi:hypothetical protein
MRIIQSIISLCMSFLIASCMYLFVTMSMSAEQQIFVAFTMIMSSTVFLLINKFQSI